MGGNGEVGEILNPIILLALPSTSEPFHLWNVGYELYGHQKVPPVSALEPGDEEFTLKDQFLGQVLIQPHEKLVLRKDIATPFVRVHRLQLVEPSSIQTREIGRIEIFPARHPTESGLVRSGSTLAPI